MKLNKNILIYEEWGKHNGRLYYVIYVYKKDKRYRLGKRKIFLRSEFLDEAPFSEYSPI